MAGPFWTHLSWEVVLCGCAAEIAPPVALPENHSYRCRGGRPVSRALLRGTGPTLLPQRAQGGHQSVPCVLMLFSLEVGALETCPDLNLPAPSRMGQ